ncbi:MAG: sigma-70 family RNA polymerase sigma factor [Gemmataceae bacterium]
MADELSLNTADLTYWVAELQAGRPQAAGPEFRKILARVELLSRAMFKKFVRVGRFVEVEDVTQNVLVRMLRALESTRPNSTRHFYSLTNELIRRELLDLARHYYGPRGHGSNLTGVVVGGGEGEFAPADTGATDAGGAELDRLTIFHEAIAELPIEQREAVGLTYYHGWTQAQIAELFQVSVRTVQRWTEAAATALREKVGQN